jgi:hypothetical protein
MADAMPVQVCALTVQLDMNIRLVFAPLALLDGVLQIMRLPARLVQPTTAVPTVVIHLVYAHQTV